MKPLPQHHSMALRRIALPIGFIVPLPELIIRWTGKSKSLKIDWLESQRS